MRLDMMGEQQFKVNTIIKFLKEAYDFRHAMETSLKV